MSLLASCPQCGCTYAKGGRCPQCRYSDSPDTGFQEQSYAAVYQQRRDVHRRNYAIYMGLIFVLTTVTLTLIGVAYTAVRSPRTMQHIAAGPTISPQPIVQQPVMPAEGNGDEDDPADPADPVAAGGALDDDIDLGISFNPPIGLLLLLLGLIAAEGALSFAVWKSKEWWPIELLCPKCNARLDEMGDNLEYCPSCETRLR